MDNPLWVIRFFVQIRGEGDRTWPEVNEAQVGPKPAAASGGNRQAERRESQGAAESRDYASSPGCQNRATLARRAARGDSSMLHQTSASAEVFSFAKTQLNINVEPGEGVNDSPAGCQS